MDLSGSATTRVKGASPLVKSLKKLALTCKRLNVFWNRPVSKVGAEWVGQFNFSTGF